MNVIPLDVPALKLVLPSRHEDSRGFLSEMYNRRALSAGGISVHFVQDN